MTEMNFETMRRAMVASQLRTNAVNDPRVIAAMSSVPRERFVPAERQTVAYVDRPVPLGNGRALNPPATTGLLLTEGAVRASDRVLLIGAATGYTAAVLAELAGHVTALEVDTDLATQAQAALGGSPKVTIVTGPLEAGWQAGAPYDLILVDGAVEQVPDALVDQLTPDGRLATGLVDGGVLRLALGRKAGGGFGLRVFADEEAVRLPGFQRPQGFTFP